MATGEKTGRERAAEPPKNEEGLERARTGEIEEVTLTPMSGPAVIRAKVRRKIGDALKVGAASALAAYIAGTAAQGSYREAFEYDPDAEAAASEPAEGVPAEEGGKGEGGKEQGGKDFEPGRKKNLWQRAKERAKNTLAKAKDWVKTKAGKSEIAKKYRDVREELDELKRTILETGDAIAFWVPFLLTFLASLLVLGKLLAYYRHTSEAADPLVAQNFRMLEESLNGLTREVKALRAGPPPDQQAITGMVEDLSRRLDELERWILTGKKDAGAGEDGPS